MRGVGGVVTPLAHLRKGGRGGRVPLPLIASWARSSRVSVLTCESDMDRHGITAAIGEARVFTTLHEAVAAVRDGGLGARPER